MEMKRAFEKLGYLLLLIFCTGMFASEVWSFYLPPWASAQVLGFDLVKLLFMALFGWGIVWSWRRLKKPFVF